MRMSSADCASPGNTAFGAGFRDLTSEVVPNLNTESQMPFLIIILSQPHSMSEPPQMAGIYGSCELNSSPVGFDRGS